MTEVDHLQRVAPFRHGTSEALMLNPYPKNPRSTVRQYSDFPY